MIVTHYYTILFYFLQDLTWGDSVRNQLVIRYANLNSNSDISQTSDIYTQTMVIKSWIEFFMTNTQTSIF